MLTASLDPSYKLFANVRPVKIAYFLHEDDEGSLTRILRLVCTQWGGIRHFLIPVANDGSIEPYFSEILKRFDPDMLVGFFSTPSPQGTSNQLQDSLHKTLQDLLPDRKVKIQEGGAFEKEDLTAHALHVIPEEELKRKPLYSYGLEPDLQPAWMGLAIFGAIYPGQEDFYAQSVHLRDRRIQPMSREFWERQLSLDPFDSILNLTHYQVSPFETTNASESNNFNVFVVNSVKELCGYWNSRSLRESVQWSRDERSY